MNSGEYDVLLKLISQKRVAWFAAPLAIGSIFWDLRTGLYSPRKPDVDTVLDYLDDTFWSGRVRRIADPLKQGSRANVVFDFDRKRVLNDSRAGASNVIFLSWMMQSLSLSVLDPFIPKESIKSHLESRRLELIDGDANDPKALGVPLKCCTLKGAFKEISTYKNKADRQGRCVDSVRLALPPGWSLKKKVN